MVAFGVSASEINFPNVTQNPKTDTEEIRG
jgi:hypothetical protein